MNQAYIEEVSSKFFQVPEPILRGRGREIFTCPQSIYHDSHLSLKKEERKARKIYKRASSDFFKVPWPLDIGGGELLADFR